MITRPTARGRTVVFQQHIRGYRCDVQGIVSSEHWQTIYDRIHDGKEHPFSVDGRWHNFLIVGYNVDYAGKILKAHLVRFTQRKPKIFR